MYKVLLSCLDCGKESTHQRMEHTVHVSVSCSYCGSKNGIIVEKTKDTDYERSYRQQLR